LRVLLRIVKYFFLLILLLAVLPYLTCPIYKYPETSVFTGSSFYNPYANIDSTKWLKANFHAHTRVWWGLTYGHKSNADELVNKYKELRYDVIGISDYQAITPQSSIPVYEHGIGLSKNHQLSIGAQSILWKEYLFYQNFHHKQNIISGLREKNNLISVNHPDMLKAYDSENIKYLRGIDLLEVINHNYFNAQALWDTALSNGQALFLISDDDSHDITNPKDFGYGYTMVNSASANTGDIIASLKNGAAVAVEMEPKPDMSVAAKLKQSALIPMPLKYVIHNDSLLITFNKLCDTIKLIGQNGRLLEKRISAGRISYRLKPEDTYVRTEVNQNDLSNIILNPVFRYDGVQVSKTEPEINQLYTWLFRGGLITAAVLILTLKVKRQRKRMHHAV
jgi:hypothetical protein